MSVARSPVVPLRRRPERVVDAPPSIAVLRARYEARCREFDAAGDLLDSYQELIRAARARQAERAEALALAYDELCRALEG